MDFKFDFNQWRIISFKKMKTNQILLIKVMIWERDIIWLSKKLIYFIFLHRSPKKAFSAVWPDHSIFMKKPLQSHIDTISSKPWIPEENTDKPTIRLSYLPINELQWFKVKDLRKNHFVKNEDGLPRIRKKKNPKCK